jgi:dipeptidyl aminopeptidase/acylaminoacyl peptidase
MRHVPIPWCAGWTALVLVLSIALDGCGKDDPTKPPPPLPQLTSPRIAFTRGVNGIHLYDPATGTVVELSHGSADEEPAISHDGRRIAFVNSSGGTRRLMTMAVNGTDRVPVLEDIQLSPAHPHWSSDNTRLVFTGTTLPSGAYNVYTILASGDSLRPLTSDGSSRALAWSPDGSRILYLYTDAAQADSVRDMLPSGLGIRFVAGPTGGLVGADYSPDGTNIVFAHSDGVGIRMPDISEIGQPSWSPDGSWIVISAHPVGGGTYDLFLTTPTPADTVQLLLGGSENDVDPDWGPRP